MNNLIGTKIGQYELQEKIGEGSIGQVYVGKHSLLPKTKLAFKVTRDRVHFDYLTREATLLDKLSGHPYIITIRDYGINPEFGWIGLDYIEHEPEIRSTADFIKKKGPISIETAVAIAENVFKAIEYAHSLGVLHRDIKPSNILLNAQGQAIVTDFNLGKETDNTSSVQDSHSIYSLGGQSAFQSPEQENREFRLIDERTDVYSIALTIKYLLTGKIIREDIKTIPEGSHIPTDLADLLNGATHREHAKRITNASIMLAQIGQLPYANNNTRVKELQEELNKVKKHLDLANTMLDNRYEITKIENERLKKEIDIEELKAVERRAKLQSLPDKINPQLLDKEHEMAILEDQLRTTRAELENMKADQERLESHIKEYNEKRKEGNERVEKKYPLS